MVTHNIVSKLLAIARLCRQYPREPNAGLHNFSLLGDDCHVIHQNHSFDLESRRLPVNCSHLFHLLWRFSEITLSLFLYNRGAEQSGRLFLSGELMSWHVTRFSVTVLYSHCYHWGGAVIFWLDTNSLFDQRPTWHTSNWKKKKKQKALQSIFKILSAISFK